MTPAPKDDKYVVFKMDGTLVEDAVVIRRQDLFAPPALDSYANSISIAAMMLEPGEQRLKMQDVADYFHAQAVASWETERKLPD